MPPRIGRVGDWNNSSGNSGSQSSSRSSSSGGPRISTLRDVTSGSAGPPPGPPPTGGDSDDEDGEGENWFAGGERSGLSIQNPDSRRAVPGGEMVRDLLRRAAVAGPPPAAEETQAQRFSGGGHTLGGDEMESNYVPDPTAREPEEETAIRRLAFFRDGFTVEGGELMRYDDPANETILAEINSGRAPPSILNVLPGQPVELRVERRTDEDYIPPARTVGGFRGVGNRLGAPVPGSPPPSEMPGSFVSTSSSPATSSGEAAGGGGTKFEVDQTLPTTSIQLRLADGTRIVARMNLTHTVGDIRSFINAARPENLTRQYEIMTTFPNKALDDDSKTVEAAGLKNSVVVQKWV